MASDRTARVKQLVAAFKLTARRDRAFVPIVVGTFLGTLVVLVLAGIFLGHPIIGTVFAVLLASSAAMIVFGRRASKAAFAEVDGQAGAAAAVLESMRGNWRVTPVVALTRNQDLVHRVVGRPGVVLVGEGNSNRVAALLVQEKRKIARVAAETPVYEVVVGEAGGQVPIRKLQTHMMKLPRNLKPGQVLAVEARMRALGTATVPIPKGPMPRNARVPRGGRMR